MTSTVSQIRTGNSEDRQVLVSVPAKHLKTTLYVLKMFAESSRIMPSPNLRQMAEDAIRETVEVDHVLAERMAKAPDLYNALHTLRHCPDVNSDEVDSATTDALIEADRVLDDSKPAFAAEKPPVPEIDEALLNPSTPYWFKSALEAALRADPVDAVNAAEVLCSILAKRADELLRA